MCNITLDGSKVNTQALDQKINSIREKIKKNKGIVRKRVGAKYSGPGVLGLDDDSPANKPAKDRTPVISNFGFVVSTNIPYKDKKSKEAKKDKETFKCALDLMAAKMVRDGSFVKVQDPVAVWDKTFIKKIKVKNPVEYGDKRNILHAHILWAFKHKTRLQLDRPAMKNFLAKELNMEGLWISDFIIVPEEHITDYISYIDKNQRRRIAATGMEETPGWGFQ